MSSSGPWALEGSVLTLQQSPISTRWGLLRIKRIYPLKNLYLSLASGCSGYFKIRNFPPKGPKSASRTCTGLCIYSRPKEWQHTGYVKGCKQESWVVHIGILRLLVISFGSKITADGDCSHEIKRRLLLGRKSMTNLDKPIKKQTHHFADKGPYSQSYDFSSSHVQFWELDHKEAWALKNWCFGAGQNLESPLDCKEIKSVNQRGNSTPNIHWKDWCWSSNSLATWCLELTPW